MSNSEQEIKPTNTRQAPEDAVTTARIPLHERLWVRVGGGFVVLMLVGKAAASALGLGGDQTVSAQIPPPPTAEPVYTSTPVGIETATAVPTETAKPRPTDAPPSPVPTLTPRPTDVPVTVTPVPGEDNPPEGEASIETDNTVSTFDVAISEALEDVTDKDSVDGRVTFAGFVSEFDEESGNAVLDADYRIEIGDLGVLFAREGSFLFAVNQNSSGTERRLIAVKDEKGNIGYVFLVITVENGEVTVTLQNTYLPLILTSDPAREVQFNQDNLSTQVGVGETVVGTATVAGELIIEAENGFAEFSIVDDNNEGRNGNVVGETSRFPLNPGDRVSVTSSPVFAPFADSVRVEFYANDSNR
jgi:hypothetical protein